jgi:hypothetical protein
MIVLPSKSYILVLLPVSLNSFTASSSISDKSIATLPNA